MPLKVLGVDPGSSATGWALICAEGNRYRLESHGVLRSRGSSRAQRLADLDLRFRDLLRQLVPDAAAVESSFSGLNPASGLQLAECRGVLLAALGHGHLEVHSYSPAQVKSAVVGHGRAEKQQVVYMVSRLLALDTPPPQDAADAMAVAITHLHTFGTRRRR
jgi:crossover junction endodeoxyribonuclease RuvC